MKNKILLFIFSAFFALNLLNAQVTVDIGAGTGTTTGTGETPFGTYYHDNHNQILFLASELTAAGLGAGNITEIGWNVASAASQTMNGFNIEMKHTTATSVTTFESGFQNCYSGSHTATAGWNVFTLSTPFNWNGTDNLLVKVCFDNTTYTSNSSVYYTTTANPMNGYAYTDGGTGCSLSYTSNSTQRPNTRITGAAGSGGCTGISTFPYAESFESGFGDWQQSTGDDFDWTRNSGSTGSTGTGPSAAYDGSYYLYTESSSPNYPAKTAGVYAEFCFATGSVTSPQIDFAYHMYGAAMGTLTLHVSTDGGVNWSNEWSMSGDQGNSWHTTTVDLSAYGNTDNVLLRWWGLTGTNFTSDMAVDDISVYEAGTGPITLPWTEDWESVGPTTTFTSNADPINGATEWAYDKTANGRLQFTAYAHNGTQAAAVDANPSGVTSINYLIATLDIASYASSTDLELSFWHMQRGEESHSNDRVWVRGSDSDSWIEIYDLYANQGGSGTWVQVSALDIDAAISGAGQTITSTFQIRFGQEDNYPFSSDGRVFDDITLQEVTCPPPDNQTANGITATSADLGWNENGSATTWDIELGLAGFTPTGTPTQSGVTSNPYTYGGLSANTSYDWYVRADCGGSYSPWTGPHTFTTACAAFSAPFLEPFDDGGSLPNCWSMSGPENWNFSTGAAYGAAVAGDHTSGGGTDYAWVDGSGSGTNNGITLVTPIIDVSALSTPYFRFWYFSNNIDNPGDNNTLYCDMTIDGGGWANVFTYQDDNPDWQSFVLDLSTYMPFTTVQFRFVVDESASTAYYNDILVDDVEVTDGPFITPGLWTGANSSDWADGGNWDDGNVPDATVDVTIPDGCPNYPVIDEMAECQNITIETGSKDMLSIAYSFKGEEKPLTQDGAGSDLATRAATKEYYQPVQPPSGKALTKVTIATGASFMVAGNFTAQGELEVNDGSIYITGDFYLQNTGTFDMNGGTFTASFIGETAPYTWASGISELSGGTINVTSSAFFYNTSGGSVMDGPFVMDVGATLQIDNSTFTTVTDGTVNMTGTSGGGVDQYVLSPNTGEIVELHNLTISYPGGSYVFVRNTGTNSIQINNDFTVVDGTANTKYAPYSNDSFTVGGEFEVTANGTFMHGDITTFSVGTYNLDPMSTYNYNGDSPQSILAAGSPYGILVSSGNGAKTPDGNFQVDSFFDVFTDVDLGGYDGDILGNITIENGATLNGNTGNLNVQGSWFNDQGTFNPGSGTVTFNGTGQSNVDKTGSVGGGTPGNITTLFASNNGATSNYFDITASGTEDITIESFDVNTSSTGSVTAQAWYYPNDTYTNHTTDPAGWVQIGTTQTITGMGIDIATPFDPGGTVTIPAGQTYGFFISVTNIRYTNGDGSNQNYSDSYLTLDLGMGSGTATPGGGNTYDPRVWNGTVYYSYGGGTTVAIETFNNLVSDKTTKAANDVYLNCDVTVSGNLTVNSGSRLNVRPTYSLTVNGTTTLNDSDCFRLLANATGYASFIDGGTFAGTGTARMQQYITPSQWHLVSSPLSNGLTGVYTGLYLKEFNESDSSWTYLVPTNLPLVVGKGYSLWSSSGAVTKNFIGNLNTGDVSPTNLTYNDNPGEGHGWNLIGNPYPSLVEWNTNWTTSNVDETIYVYDGTAGQYLSWNRNTLIGTKGNGLIPPTQGFWIKGNAATPSVTIPNSERTHTYEPFYKGYNTNDDLLQLTVDGKNYDDLTIIDFDPNSSLGFDSEYDAYKIKGISQSPQLYSIIPETILAVNVLPAVDIDMVIPVGFEAGEDFQYVLNAVNIQDFNPEVDIYLEDLQNNTVTNLRTKPQYSFSAAVGDEEHRFNILFRNIGENEPGNHDEDGLTENDMMIFASENVIHVVSDNVTDGELVIVDMLGREILKESFTGNNYSTSIDVPSGYYLVKVVSANSISTRKVFVR